MGKLTTEDAESTEGGSAQGRELGMGERWNDGERERRMNMDGQD